MYFLIKIQIERKKGIVYSSFKCWLRNLFSAFNYPSYISPVRSYSKNVKVEDVAVDFDYVKKAISNHNILIIDVREPDEIKEHGKIPNSINIPCKFLYEKVPL